MNRFKLSLFTILLSTIVFSQSEEDYNSTLELINKAFNQKEASLIHNQFSADLKSSINEASFKKMIDSLYVEKSQLQSIDLLMEDDSEKSYLVDFEKGAMLMLLKLDTNNKISTFKITEY